MSDWNNLSSSDLIAMWSEFRHELDKMDLSEDDILAKVVDFWSTTPRGGRTVDYYTPDSWPSPWEILHYRTYCKSSVSLMMYYTLVLLDTIDEEKIELYRIDEDDEYVIPVYDNKYVLNYEYAKLTDINEIDINNLTKINKNDIHKVS